MNQAAQQPTDQQMPAPTADDIAAYEVRTNAMLAALQEQRDEAQLKVVTMRGEVAAGNKRMEQLKGINTALQAHIAKQDEQIKELIAAAGNATAPKANEQAPAQAPEPAEAAKD